MSKKSRRRNKRLLMLAALAGGAAFLGRGKGKGTKETISDAQKAHNFAAAKSALISKKDVLPETTVADTAPISKNIFRTRHRLTDSAGTTIPSTNKMANIAAMNAPKGIYPPGSVPMPLRAGNLRGFNRKDGGRIGAKHGGSVKGVGKAKRGFGRALKKGK